MAGFVNLIQDQDDGLNQDHPDADGGTTASVMVGDSNQRPDSVTVRGGLI